MLEDDALPKGEVIGIVIGAIVLFAIISILPIILVRYRRRNAATAASRPNNQALALSASMEQVSVERWLEQQNTTSDIEQYAEDTCPICLSPLSSSPNLQLTYPKPAHLPRRTPLGSDVQVNLDHNVSEPTITVTPSDGDGSCCGAAGGNTDTTTTAATTAAASRTRRTRRDSGILVLNRCHHAFHSRCLSSWFEYRHFRCPICQARYSPAEMNV